MFHDLTGEEIHMFRSEPMEYVQFVFPREAAYQSVFDLGKLGIAQFEDMNPSINANAREFIGEIKRCDEMLRRLRYFRTQLVRHNLQTEHEPEIKQFNFTEIESQFEELERTIQTHTNNLESIKKHENEILEFKYVLELGSSLNEDAPVLEDNPAEIPADYHPIRAETGTVKLNSVCGVIPADKVETLQRMCYVVSRGNVFVRTIPVPQKTLDVGTEVPVQKEVFVTFFSGEHLRKRITKIAESFSGSIYPISSSQQEKAEMLAGIDARLAQLRGVKQQTEAALMEQMKTVQEQIDDWQAFVVSEKQIFVSLNMFSTDLISNCFVGEGWVPTRNITAMHQALAQASAASGATVPSIARIIKRNATDEVNEAELNESLPPTSSEEAAIDIGGDVGAITREGFTGHSNLTPQQIAQRRKEMRKRRRKPPPTLIRTTKVTQAFQALVDSYGTAVYREVNPGLITFVTFPYIFGIMFGDFGHGLLLALVGLYFCLNEKKFKHGLDDLTSYLFIGRYMILLMGLVAAFIGFMYNECFSLSMNFFGSSWECDEESFDCRKTYTYWLGFDPIWRQSENNLIFANSIKMKLSVIVGVLHMVFGVAFKGANEHYWKDKVGFWFEFVPQMLMMLSFFGYMCFIIIYKWLFVSDPETAPLLIRTLINMVLAFNDPIEESQRLFPGQEGVQRFLIVLYAITIPWMFCFKPYFVYREHKKKMAAQPNGYQNLDDANKAAPGNLSSESSEDSAKPAVHPPSADDDEEDEFSLGEVIVNQMIETIEYTLSCISNTASYLRLWALSLAHGQLAEVFFNYGVIKAGQLAGAFGAAIGVTIWIGTTFAILLAMEGLSAFLHALRLHWVELQNKFYKATGVEFLPLSFDTLVNDDIEQQIELERNEKERLEKIEA